MVHNYSFSIFLAFYFSKLTRISFLQLCESEAMVFVLKTSLKLFSRHFFEKKSPSKFKHLLGYLQNIFIKHLRCGSAAICGTTAAAGCGKKSQPQIGVWSIHSRSANFGITYFCIWLFSVYFLSSLWYTYLCRWDK